MKNRLLALIFITFSLAGPSIGWSTTTQFAAFDLWPSVGDRYFFSTSSSQGLYRMQYTFDLSNSFVFQPLDVLNPAGTRLRSVIDYYFGHFFSAGLGITDFWQVGFTLPLFSRARFESPTTVVSTGATNVSEIGDLRFTSKVRIINSNRHRFGLALEPFADIPLGADDHFLGESKATGGARVLGDLLLTERIRLALNLGTEIRAERVVISNIDFNHRFLAGLGLSAGVARNLTASAEAQASTPFGNFFGSKDVTPVEFLGGVQWDIGKTGLKVGAGGGSCAVCGVKGAKARAFLNLGYRRTGESYTLKEREEAEMRVVNLGGTMKPALETYEMVELSDKCPVNVGSYQIGRDDPRCTEIYELRAIAEACPEEGTFDPQRDNPKCRQVYTLQEKDTDNDGVPDFEDRCPLEPGKKEEHGCPTLAYLIRSPEENQTLDQMIPFDFGQASLRADSRQTLNALATTLKSQPAVELLSIEGHTDNIGSEARNQSLSVARAVAVYRYLVSRGVPPDRLRTRGFGSSRPVENNRTDAGRSKNRRVEFVIKRAGKLP